MITGTISRHRAYVPVVVRGPGGLEGQVEFVLDTGFTGLATLPVTACQALGLPFARLQPSRLADGTRVMLDVFDAIVSWDGADRSIQVLGMDGAPLIGMALLDGQEVHLQVVAGGSVIIEQIP
jgi:clan AA aspartic protease